MPELEVRQVRSATGSNPAQRETLRSLRLGRIGSRASHADTPQLRGMIRRVEHLVTVAGEGSSD